MVLNRSVDSCQAVLCTLTHIDCTIRTTELGGSMLLVYLLLLQSKIFRETRRERLVVRAPWPAD
jgi:hypothetical protein